MKKILLFYVFLFGSLLLKAQTADDDVYDEQAMIEKVTALANKVGYTQTFRLPEDTSRSFVAEPGKAYRLVLIFREHIETPGRRLVVYQKDKKNNLKTLFMARKDQHVQSLNGHMLVTDLPAVAAGETYIYMTIDALPKEGKLFIFSK